MSLSRSNRKRQEVARNVSTGLSRFGFHFSCAILACCVSVCATAQDYMQEIARPTFSEFEPVQLGAVNVANGNLHLEIPLGSFPQRGGRPLAYKLMYDSRIWLHGPGVWNVNSWATNLGGWRFVTSADPGTVGNGGAPNSCPGGQYDNFYWTAPDGTTRLFPIVTATPSCPGNYTGRASAQDASGYVMSVINSNQVSAVLAPDGTQVYPYYKDTNGNYYSKDANGNIIDTLGRTPVIVTSNGTNGCATNQICYDILNSQGSTQPGRSRITVTTATISVHTAFNEQYVTENTGTLKVIQSILLPDGTSYQFGYDSGTAAGHFGEITSATLPTGGQVSYSYSVYQDATNPGISINHWLTGYSGGGGSWSYVLGNVNPTNQTQNVTVTKPSGDSKVYSFTLNNGAWANSITYYSAGNSNPPKLLQLIWDTSHACTSPCTGTGAIYVRKSTEIITTGNVQRKAAFSYSDTASSLSTTISEWNYYPVGQQPTNPSRITNFVYWYTNNSAYGPSAANILNRPASVIVTDGTGNTKLKETDFTYDDPGSLTSIPGIVQHDPTYDSTGLTVRGNRTSVKQWMGGTSYQTMSAMTYDTTGQVASNADQNGNKTTFSYTDHFANDNGSNPPASYTPSQPTNAFLTTITLPKVGAVQATILAYYYFGTGKIAWTQDQNGAKTYHHFQDIDDRKTTDYFPTGGWLLDTYTSATQVDTYMGIQDASPSSGCSSCRHDQGLSDNLGRAIDQILVSDPDGQTTVKTDYDSNGRVLDTSHPFRSTSDPTYGLETVSYDGLNRPIQTTHPDGTTRKMYYGANVTAAGGLPTQKCGASCQLGYPTVTVDEAGKMRQVWTDAFGKTVEVDEPAATASSGGSGAASGTVTFSGTEGTATIYVVCGPNGQTCPFTVYDGGTFTVTVGGVSERIQWGGGSSTTSATIATSTASAFNSDPTSPVTAAANGSVVTFTSKFNYPLGPASTDWNTQYFSSPSFSASFSGANMTGGAGPQMSSPTTTYSVYDLLGNLTQVTVLSSQECNRTYTYDTFSRMTSSTEPEPGNGVCTSITHTTNYYYTTSGGALCSGNPGSVCRQTDGRSITKTATYDALNRQTGVTYSDGTTPAVTYSYDQTSYNGLTITNGILRKTGMSDGSGMTAWSYDLNGNIVTEKRKIGTVTKTISYAYNNDNSLKTLTYPSGRVVNFTVGNAQRTTSVVDGDGTKYVLPPSSGSMYAPTGALLSAVYGKGTALPNGLTETRTYNNHLQITGISASSSVGTALNLSYGYTSTSHPNNNGELLSVTNAVDNGRNQTNTFDDLGRVLSASSQATSGADCWGQSFTIDNVANLTNMTTTQCSGGAFSSAVNGNNQLSTGYTYDAAGNLTNDGLYTYTFNGENEITAANGVTYTYDGNRMRVQKSNGTLYWRDVAGSTIAETNLSGGNVNEYVFFASRRIAQRNSSGNLYYYQSDQIRTIRSITKVPTSGSATICYDADFTPYGSEVAHTSGCIPNYKFTGYERDSETGLDYAMNRYYNPRAGRFMNPDPMGIASASPMNPQSLNRYAYVMNNPMSGIDPLGLECVWDDGSYDSESDVNTGNSSSCSSQGGTWVELGQNGNWSSVPGAVLIAYGLVTVVNVNDEGLFDFKIASNAYNWTLCPPYCNAPPTIPTVSQWRPPKSKSQVKAPYKPLPYKPSVAECFTSPGNAVDLMTEGSIPETPDTLNSTPQIYQNTNRGTVLVNSEQGEAQASFLALALDTAGNFVGCMAGALF